MIHWLLLAALASQGAVTAAPAAEIQGPAARAGKEATVRAIPAEALDDAVSRVASRLRCPVCQQLSILDSPAELAQEMKAVVRERLAAGQSEEEVIAYFVAKYGEWILLDPPKRGFNLVVWLGPLALLAGGGVVLALVFRRWLRAGSDTATEEDRSSELPARFPVANHS